jgi:hypothetical protein
MELQQATSPPPQSQGPVVSRRTALKYGSAVAAAAATLNLLDAVAWRPLRPVVAEAATLPDIQFDIGAFIAPAQMINGVQFQFGPVYTTFATAALSRLPTKTEQATLANALNTIESAYPFSPSGAFVFVSYGLPYFRRLPAALVSANIPRLATNTSRSVLEEAVPSPTDVHPSNPGVTKRKFNVTVRIESNDLLFTVRSDNPGNISDILNWLAGSNRLAGRAVTSPSLPLSFTSARVMFLQPGMPRLVASNNHLPFIDVVNDQSPMWMGFADQQTSGSGPPQIVTFQGNGSARLTTATPGSYFDNGSIQHLSHVILDLEAFYARAGEAGSDEDETYLERVQYMFRSNPPPSLGNPGSPFSNGGGPSFLPNDFRGAGDALANASGNGTLNGEHRIGHLSALQRSSRAADGTPIHLRMDGPGFDSMDVPPGVPIPWGSRNVPKLQFTVFVPTADFFATMRRNQASLDLQNQFGVDLTDNGLERFLTATRRQNFLIPPRRHRAFPLLELT